MLNRQVSSFGLVTAIRDWSGSFVTVILREYGYPSIVSESESLVVAAVFSSANHNETTAAFFLEAETRPPQKTGQSYFWGKGKIGLSYFS